MRKFFIFCTLLAQLDCYAEIVSEGDIYIAKDVCVEVFDVDPVDIRSNAMQQAKSHASNLLLSSLNHPNIELLNEEVDRMVQDYEIKEETLFKQQKYKLCLNISFNKNSVKDVLTRYNISQQDKEIYGTNKVDIVCLTDGNLKKWIKIRSILEKNNVHYHIRYIDYSKVVIRFNDIAVDKLVDRVNNIKELEVIKNGNEYFLSRL